MACCSGPGINGEMMSNQWPRPDRRPGELSAAGAIGLVLAFLGALGGIAYLYLASATSDSPPSGLLVGSGFGLLVAAVVMVVGSLGVLGRRAWARIALTGSVVVSAALAVLAMWSWGLIFLVAAELVGGTVVVALAWTDKSSRWLRPAVA